MPHRPPLIPLAVAVVAGLAAPVGSPTPAGAVSPYDPPVNTSRAAVAGPYRTQFLPAVSTPATFADTALPGKCQAATPSASLYASELAQVNFFRRMAGLDPVMHTPEHDRYAQWAATLMAANGRLDHFPDATWDCYPAADTPDGNLAAIGAGSSNLAMGDKQTPLYMNDWGTPSLGHRRWVLYPPTETVGIGVSYPAYGNYSALRVFGMPTDWTNTNPASVAWPSAGWFPSQLTVGSWSFSGQAGASWDFTGATVTMTRGGGVPVSVTNVRALDPHYGADTMAWDPVGIPPYTGSAYATYTTSISGIKRDGVAIPTVTYSTVLFDATYGNPDGSTPTTLGGYPYFGATLEARTTAWQPAAASLSYQWYRMSGDRVMAIAGATGRQYRPTLTDSGWNITVVVKGTTAGQPDRTSVAPRTAPVTNVPAPSPAPYVTGTARIGQRVYANMGQWTPPYQTRTYQWYRVLGTRSMAIGGATGQSYSPTRYDSGWRLTVKVTGHNPWLPDRSRVAASTAVVGY